ncbi:MULTISPECIES: helix-turn-helix domain-containing protein [Acinetobacter calcoaceticus/baumannii complex]|uniref:helix-turn-helix domain-containing protein n=1 Tax=Acinetobacter calcoaceticus/baumannii complex TaxID=909768 RepID=UPI00044FCCC4|nr:MULTISPECIES: XRE family transcriptional regulator [Acinetobacter calcoaceticus/baumannii complex]AJB48491.1 DNA-binding protein [Acinetobacter nosocomialis]EXE78136.1 helix-turn-helix family protein [Acinetobacter sp. 1566109]MBJ9961678.1 helix-turn-helix transcriptional regulator [Acinetobacter nosocomialis]MBR7738730.1 helix-turn-helix transcriptional regulator [Acinetobacter nosocomialis]MBR7748736.1 helix-turn-helix transcriptional regulator [Acinetobacter nosocomialis]
MEDINIRIAQQVRELRLARGYTLDVLATRCQVSRSAISLIERGEASPTAVVLEKLANGLGVPLTQLFDIPQNNQSPQPMVRRTQQSEWKDPETGYIRRTVSPPNLKLPFQIVEIEFPPHARITYEISESSKVVQQQLWVVEGQIDIQLGKNSYALGEGDCLAMQLDQPVIYSNNSSQVARYILVVSNQLVSALKESS